MKHVPSVGHFGRLLVGHAPLDEAAARSLAAELTRSSDFRAADR
jgi:hypothetical protein